MTDKQLTAQVQYLINNNWTPSIEFAEPDRAVIKQDMFAGPAYYDNRYWTMWKLPMFGCSDGSAVLKELAECKKAYPSARVRVIGFDAIRQVQMAGFLAVR